MMFFITILCEKVTGGLPWLAQVKNNLYICLVKKHICFIKTKLKHMNTMLLFMGIGTQELLFIALIVLLLFGGKKIPELMKGLGKGVKSFKDGMNGVEENLKDSAEKTDKPENKEK
jgi:sec-independent protein translocase protein TatA